MRNLEFSVTSGYLFIPASRYFWAPMGAARPAPNQDALEGLRFGDGVTTGAEYQMNKRATKKEGMGIDEFWNIYQKLMADRNDKAAVNILE